MQARTKRLLAVAVAAIALLAIASVIAMAILRRAQLAPPPAVVASPATTVTVMVVDTPHYRITSSADAAQTARTGAAVEALHAAWTDFFAYETAPVAHAPLQLRLYRDQAEFKANNRSSPWAEAYYREPTCHAYFAADRPNPTHWMLHEAVHQLNREIGGIATAKWQSEGLATFFSASPLRDGALDVGAVDPGAYPIWWLADMELSGDLAADIAAGRIIPLRTLLAGSGPPIAQNVNLYYLHWWSLTHFLLRGDDGRHATAYRRLLHGDGSLAEFEREFADVEALQAAWYDYLRARVADAREADHAERLRLPDLVGQRVEISGDLQGGHRLGDYINVAGQAIYLPDARMSTAAPYGSRVVVSGLLQHDAGVQSDCTVEPDCVASVPGHYFIPAADVRLESR